MVEILCTMVFIFGPLDMNTNKPVTWDDVNWSLSRKEHCFAVKDKRKVKMPKRRGL